MEHPIAPNMNGASLLEEDLSVTRVKPDFASCFQHRRTTVSNLSWGSTWSRKCTVCHRVVLYFWHCGAYPWGLVAREGWWYVGGGSSVESQLRQPFWTHPWERPVMTSETPRASSLPQPDSVTLRVIASSRPCQTEGNRAKRTPCSLQTLICPAEVGNICRFNIVFRDHSLASDSGRSVEDISQTSFKLKPNWISISLWWKGRSCKGICTLLTRGGGHRSHQKWGTCYDMIY